MLLNIYGTKSLELAENAEGGQVIFSKKTSSIQQRWTVVYSEKEVALKTEGLQADFGFSINRPFYIISKLSFGRALTVVGGRNVVIQAKKYKNVGQQFYFDNATKTIKSQQYKDKSIDIQNSGTSRNVQIWKTNGRWW
jgi:hypothetical protein